MSRRVPALTGPEVVRALQLAGFAIVRISGSHYRLVHADDPSRVTTVPVHDSKALKRGTLQSILRQSGVTAEELAALL
jgi:predicted RNA binding protein YcfA (HicA-like mRNA interferase family)